MHFKSKAMESWTFYNKFHENWPDYKEVIEVLKVWLSPERGHEYRLHNLTIKYIKQQPFGCK